MSNNDELEMTTEDESFVELFEQSLNNQSGLLTPGQKVTARVLKVTTEWIFLDTGHKGEGIVDLKEFIDQDGHPTVKEGDAVTVTGTVKKFEEWNGMKSTLLTRIKPFV